MRIAAIALFILGVAASGAHAAERGNSENAKLCQKKGWMGLVTSTGAPLTSQDECVAYGARGGALSPKPTASLLFEFGACSPDPLGSYTCAPDRLVGSGLMPGSVLYLCQCFAIPTMSPRPGNEYCAPIFIVVEADGTLPDQYEAYRNQCTTGDVYTYIAQTAEGASIRSSDTCER